MPIFDDKDLMTTVVDITQMTVFQKLGMEGREFYKNKEGLEGARDDIMINILKVISEKTGKELVTVRSEEVRNPKTGKNEYKTKIETPQFDKETRAVIENSISKAIVQMSKEINKKVQEVAMPGEKLENMNELRYSDCLLKAGNGIKASKFISNPQVEKETKRSFREVVSSFKAAIRKAFAPTHAENMQGSVEKVEKATKRAMEPGVHEKKVLATRSDERTPLLR